MSSHSHFAHVLPLNPTSGNLAHSSSWRATVTKNFSVQNGLGLYVIHKEAEILYVGETCNCIGKMEKGHRWDRQHSGETLGLHLFSFDAPPPDVFSLAEIEDDPDRSQTIRRAIESEVTYSIRTLSGRWPTRQQEISFFATLGRHRFIVDCRNFVLSHLGV